MPQFNEYQCEIMLKNPAFSGIITNDKITASISTPEVNNQGEETHLSADDLTLQYIAEQVERNPLTQIFAITKNGTQEFIINDNGLIVPKQ